MRQVGTRNVTYGSKQSLSFSICVPFFSRSRSKRKPKSSSSRTKHIGRNRRNTIARQCRRQVDFGTNFRGYCNSTTLWTIKNLINLPASENGREEVWRRISDAPTRKWTKCQCGYEQVSCNTGYLARFLTIFFIRRGKMPLLQSWCFHRAESNPFAVRRLTAPMFPIRDSSVVMILINLSKFYQQFSCRIKRNLSI